VFFFKNYSTLYLGFSAFSIEHSEVYEIHSWDFTAISDESHMHRNITIHMHIRVSIFFWH
jgi:hypothetical protein